MVSITLAMSIRDLYITTLRSLRLASLASLAGPLRPPLFTAVSKQDSFSFPGEIKGFLKGRPIYPGKPKNVGWRDEVT